MGEHKMKRMNMIKHHKEEDINTKPHNLQLIKTRQEKELSELDAKLSEELKVTDQKIILELDQVATEQQSTLQQAAVPFFKVTNNPLDIQIQIHFLNFIQRLSHEFSQ